MKTSEIDSFQDPCVLHQNWLLSRPCAAMYMAKCHKLTPFKTLTLCIILDSFQDPYIFTPKHDSLQDPRQWTILNITQLTHFKTLIWFITVFQSPWETTCKISMGDFLHPKLFKTPYTVKSRLFQETKEEDTSHASNQHISTPKINTFYIRHHNIQQNSIPFKTPKTSHQPFNSSIRLKTLSHRHRHRTRTPLPFTPQFCTYSLVTLSSLRAHYVP